MELMTNYEGIVRNIFAIVMVVQAVMLVLSILICFFGIKLFRGVMAVIGFAGGFILGFWLTAVLLKQQAEIGLAVGVIIGIIFAVIIARIRIIGVMLCSWMFGTLTAILLIQPMDLLWLCVCIGIGIVIALVSLKFSEPAVILVTSFAGGLLVSGFTTEFMGLSGKLTFYGIALVLAGIGLVVQFVLEGRKKGKQAVAAARTIKSEKSIENEIEAARALISDDDDE